MYCIYNSVEPISNFARFYNLNIWQVIKYRSGLQLLHFTIITFYNCKIIPFYKLNPSNRWNTDKKCLSGLYWACYLFFSQPSSCAWDPFWTQLVPEGFLQSQRIVSIYGIPLQKFVHRGSLLPLPNHSRRVDIYSRFPITTLEISTIV